MTEKFIKNSNRKGSWLCPFLFLYTYHQFHKDKQHLLFVVEMGHFEEHQRQLLAFFVVSNRVWLGGGFYGRAGLHELLSVVQQSIEKNIGICFTEFSSIIWHFCLCFKWTSCPAMWVRLWNFKYGGSLNARFLPKNQHAQRKLF